MVKEQLAWWPLTGWGSQQLPTVASVGRKLLLPQAHPELISDAGISSCGLAPGSGTLPDPAQGCFPDRDLNQRT